METTRKVHRGDVRQAASPPLHFALSYPREDEAVYKATGAREAVQPRRRFNALNDFLTPEDRDRGGKRSTRR